MNSILHAKGNCGEWQFAYALGDTVWYYLSGDAAAEPPATPQVAIITKIGEGHIVDLAIVAPDVSQRLSRTSVCLHGDPNLQIKAYREKGCWIPRPTQQWLSAFYQT